MGRLVVPNRMRVMVAHPFRRHFRIPFRMQIACRCASSCQRSGRGLPGVREQHPEGLAHVRTHRLLSGVAIAAGDGVGQLGVLARGGG